VVALKWAVREMDQVAGTMMIGIILIIFVMPLLWRAQRASPTSATGMVHAYPVTHARPLRSLFIVR
jgi:hypothetical protein